MLKRIAGPVYEEVKRAFYVVQREFIRSPEVAYWAGDRWLFIGQQSSRSFAESEQWQFFTGPMSIENVAKAWDVLCKKEDEGGE